MPSGHAVSITTGLGGLDQGGMGELLGTPSGRAFGCFGCRADRAFAGGVAIRFEGRNLNAVACRGCVCVTLFGSGPQPCPKVLERLQAVFEAFATAILGRNSLALPIDSLLEASFRSAIRT